MSAAQAVDNVSVPKSANDQEEEEGGGGGERERERRSYGLLALLGFSLSVL